ncbi:AraC family transcriptional regulator [Antarcticimicrobium luteum]|uniref:AraC family transcriptional regulator n=1 Tax=Antarcticimicrobium luteum TaxID=2547397 RepID=A0A4R5VCC9_9RHOB|nr:AraC family transcriptional regulator [Antarcticimicrobium luteum]TDK49880.1 AraC family transcriptional regulator [Antarcticimicrobium luteum]
MQENFERTLDELELRADPFALCQLDGECTLGLGRMAQATLHYVLDGGGEVRLRGQRALAVGRGWLVLVPACEWHSLRSLGHRGGGLPSCEPAELQLAHHRQQGEGGGGMAVLCGAVSIGMRGTHGLVDLLREPMVLDLTETPAAARAMDQILLELGTPDVGGRAMIRALLLQCLIALFRQRITAADPGLNWLAALGAPRLWSALQAMLEAPGADHSVESLAAVAAMSRSRFAAQFSEAYGAGPMELLRELRLARAARLLLDGREPVKRVADLVGFRSRSAFSRAFTARMGSSPQAFRLARRPE